MAWGNTPFVSFSVAPKEFGQKDIDSNRVADGTVLYVDIRAGLVLSW